MSVKKALDSDSVLFIMTGLVLICLILGASIQGAIRAYREPCSAGQEIR